VGIGLSAACGFRIFVPLLIMSLAAWSGHLHLAPGFEWIGSAPATAALGTATVVEILAYYIPWLDHLLDGVATPAAVIAGTLATASLITDFPPFLKWTLAVIAGGGAAGLVQGATAITRIKSSLLTGGLGNAVVATLEMIGSVVTALLALFVPVLCILLILSLCLFIMIKAGRFVFGRPKST